MQDTPSTYRERRLAKAERLREWAEKREAKADTQRNRADQIAGAIPFGQPVLVGHHSEGRHRRDLDRIASGMRNSIDNYAKADEFRRRADGIEQAADKAIYSDDEDAAGKLRVRIETLEEDRDRMKQANKAARAGVPPAEWAIGLPADLAKQAEKNLRFWPGGTDVPFPNLTNISGNIRRLRKRLESLEA